MDIMQLIYRPMEPLRAFKDFAFSRSTMAARWKQGLSDVLIALQASPWLAPMPKELCSCDPRHPHRTPGA